MRTGLLQKIASAAPSRCAICGAWPASALCPACIARFAAPQPRCRRCALPVPAGVPVCGGCLRETPPLDACYAAVSYGYPWSGLVARFKFQGEPGWAASLAALMRAVPQVDQELAAADVVLPMPLAAPRLAERGFNQALQLARELAPAKTTPKLLLRVRNTGSQSALDKAARQANVKGAFGIEPLRQGELRGKAVMLVDDVMTSGASLHAAAAAVRQAGAARVSAVVLARTDPPG
ncbi:ComF family protein [Ramlibacter sp. XY19]|uniref:ComF family protein n=1 Tax=Ramlibacter paludis TaxID=2908000 RepID=UPI0023DCCD06|nr:ComF family protein [Ramlibacter paludis]MCG2591739.1 ComF family protein [Ramlibacter paludis]